MADVALVDPELTYSLPHHITASTGKCGCINTRSGSVYFS